VKCISSTNMNATTIFEYIQKLEKELKRQKPSLYETTARTKTHAVNKDIAEHLEELAEMTSDFYKSATYKRAAAVIATFPTEVTNGASLLKIDGIGKGIVAKVDQFLDEYFESDSESVASNEGQVIDDESDESEEDSDDESETSFFISYNDKLADIFDKLASYEEDSHKRNAYRTAADAIYALPFKVKSGEELSKGPKKVKGVGKSIAKTIDEFLKTGKVEKLEKIGSTNEEIAWALEALESENPFKLRAYKNAAEIIRELDYEVTSGEELAKGPHKVEGIGKGIAAKIDEFLQTGKIK